MFRSPTVVSAALASLAASVAAQTPAPPSPSDFVQAAGQSDQYELAAARTAVAESHDAGVRAFAQQMLQDHARTSEALRQAAMASHLPPPGATMNGGQQIMLGALQSLRGREFDQAYAKQQVMAHTETLTLQQLYASAGSDPNLRQVAQTAVPIIQHHLQMAQQLRDSLSGG